MIEPTTTLDGLLNRRVAIEQPAKGYRIAADTVLLAAAVPAAAGDKVLDLGCGVGGAILCVAARAGGIGGIGVDIQPELVDLFRRNIERNSFAQGIEAFQGDVTALPPEWDSAFDHVLMNPPYHEEDRHDPSANKIKHTANMEKVGDLSLWIAAAAKALRPSGTLSLIHRADREEEILSCLRGYFGVIDILPILPKQGVDAKRVVIRARKGGAFTIRRLDGLILHKDSGGYTDIAEAILRHGQSLMSE